MAGLLLALLLLAPDAPAPDWPHVRHQGCHIEHVSTPHARPDWLLTVWVSYSPRTADKPPKPDWTSLHSARETMPQAAKDCDQWLKEARKQAERARRGKRE